MLLLGLLSDHKLLLADKKPVDLRVVEAVVQVCHERLLHHTMDRLV